MNVGEKGWCPVSLVIPHFFKTDTAEAQDCSRLGW
jgi:hypothetical protein